MLTAAVFDPRTAARTMTKLFPKNVFQDFLALCRLEWGKGRFKKVELIAAMLAQSNIIAAGPKQNRHAVDFAERLVAFSLPFQRTRSSAYNDLVSIILESETDSN